MYKAPHIRLLVTDFPSCFRFYRDTLGLTPGFGSEEDVYADFEIDGQTLALFQRPLMAEVVGTTGKAASADGQDRKEWGIRTAHFRDPDGNLIEINQGL